MADLAPAEGPLLDQILAASYDLWNEGLSPAAYRRYYAAQIGLPWGREHLRRLALVDGGEVLASAKEYLLDATLDGDAIRLIGIGAVFTPPAHRGHGLARELIERMLERAWADGVDAALLFSEIGPAYYARLGFRAIPTANLRLRVIESVRYGAPATMVRGGDDRDFAAIAWMNEKRAAAFRFHLNRSADLVQFAIARKRLLAGLSPAGARELQFFVAEEGASAVAYVVISVRGDDWTLEECGDRDPTGARVGAILQVLIAREPTAQRPVIRAWLPDGFRPPQIAVTDEQQSGEVMMIRALTERASGLAPLAPADVCYWHGDAF